VKYWMNRVTQNGRSPAHLWRSFNTMLGKDRDVTGATDHSASFFRADTAAAPPPVITNTTLSSLPSFHPASEAEVRRIIMSSPVKLCSLAPWPTFLIHEYVDLVTPCVTHLVKISLNSSQLPDNQKHATVSTLLKKSGLDMSDMSNFRPVSNVTFMSKVAERVVTRRMNDYLVEHHLLPRLQSAYRRQHSTETALLHVMSDALTAAADRQVTLIWLLDMSTAFDCVDHSILLQQLERNFGITGLTLHWMTSYITSRTQQVLYNGKLSQLQRFSYGVPQGSVLGPLLCNLYTADISKVVEFHGHKVHQYADDCQVIPQHSCL